MQNPTNPLVCLKDVELKLASRAGEVHILRGIDLDIRPGQSVAIVGPSGSGKTSMLMVLAGLERATSGHVSVADQDFTRLTEDDLAQARGRDIGIVFQSFHLVPTMTAIENVALPLEFRGDGGATETARRLLQDVGLGDRLEHYPAQLSGGEQQRVAIARALAPGPKLLLADEPTGNLDGATGQTIVDLLFGLHAEHEVTLVLVTHDEGLAAKCDRVVRMSDGIIASDTDAAEEKPAAASVRAAAVAQ